MQTYEGINNVSGFMYQGKPPIKLNHTVIPLGSFHPESHPDEADGVNTEIPEYLVLYEPAGNKNDDLLKSTDTSYPSKTDMGMDTSMGTGTYISSSAGRGSSIGMGTGGAGTEGVDTTKAATLNAIDAIDKAKFLNFLTYDANVTGPWPGKGRCRSRKTIVIGKKCSYYVEMKPEWFQIFKVRSCDQYLT